DGARRRVRGRSRAMSKLRDEIRDALMTYENDIRSVASGAEYQDTTTAAADAILAKVREALLSDEVIRQVERGTHFAPRVSSVIVTAALDAVAGEDDER